MTSEQQPFSDYYEVLGARPDMSDEELRAARREAVKRWHPDRNSAPEAEGMMRLVNAAWEVLGTPETRAEYDAVYFAWRAAEYARRAAAADEVRRGYVRERWEREAAERYTTGKGAADGVGDQEAEDSSGAGDWDADAGEGVVNDSETQPVKMDRTGWMALGIGFAGILAIVVFSLLAAIRTGSEEERRSSEVATSVAQFFSTPPEGTIRTTIGDGVINCAPGLFRRPSDHATHFWASVKFRAPIVSSWSIGYVYHRTSLPGGSNEFAATYVYKTHAAGSQIAGHWTRYGPAYDRKIVPERIRSESALSTDGDNTLRIEVNERGSNLILNGEPQVHVPIGQLDPRSSPVQFCVGFRSSEGSAYELDYWDLTGGTR